MDMPQVNEARPVQVRLKDYTILWNDGTKSHHQALTEELIKTKFQLCQAIGAVTWVEGMAERSRFNSTTKQWVVEDIIIRHKLSNGDILVLSYTTGTYPEVGEISYIQLFYGERCEQTIYDGVEGSYTVYQVQYFPVEKMSEAVFAFNKRAGSTKPAQATKDGYSIKQIIDFKRNGNLVFVPQIIDTIHVVEQPTVQLENIHTHGKDEVKLGNWNFNPIFDQNGKTLTEVTVLNVETGRQFKLDFSHLT